MTIRSRSIALVCAFIALSAISSLAWAALGTLDAPSLGTSKNFSEATYQKVKVVLERKDCKYLGGGWLNANTSLRYGGDTTALNKFVEALSLCPDVKVHVNFFRPSPGGVECDWMVTHDAHTNELVVRINLASEKVKMEDLYLPPVKAEKASE
jgi:hypothetical protein